MQNVNGEDYFTLNNFEDYVDEKHYQPGKSLFRHRKISLDRNENGNWIATVEDGMFFNVNVRILDNNKIVKCECGCSSERMFCRHSAGVLLAIRDVIEKESF